MTAPENTATKPTLTDFLLARIAEDEAVARALLRDLDAQIEAEGYHADERGPFTPARMLAAQLWAHYDGQTKWRNFARGQHVATLANPTRVLAECEAKRRIVELHETFTYHPDNSRRPVNPRPDTFHCDCQVEDGVISAKEPCETKCILALPYADHPDFREEWRA